MQLNSGGQGVVGPSDQTTPRTPHTAPFLSIEQSATCSATPPRPTEGAADADRPTIDAAEEGESEFQKTVQKVKYIMFGLELG